MKTSNILLSGFLITAFILASWFIVNARLHIDTSFIETSGNRIAKTVDLPPFSKIKVQGKFDVQVEQGSGHKVEINADETIFPTVVTEVIGGELVIRLQSLIMDRDRVHVRVTTPQIQSLDFSAGSKLSTIGEISGDELTINSYAGSHGSLSLKYNSLICDSKAGSSLTIDGTVHKAQVSSMAGSRVDAKNLETNISKVEGNSGSQVEIRVNEELHANISSGGSLGYYGNPVKTNFNSSSGGSINKK